MSTGAAVAAAFALCARTDCLMRPREAAQCFNGLGHVTWSLTLPLLPALGKTENGTLTYAAHYTLYTTYYAASAILDHWTGALREIRYERFDHSETALCNSL